MTISTLYRPPTIVMDCDGTLVDVSSIRHTVTGNSKNFDAFHRESVNCPPIEWVVRDAEAFAFLGYQVIQVTARSEKYRALTSWWLADHHVPSDGLYMRPDGDYRPDYEVKKEIITRLLKRYDIQASYDDNPSIINLWKEFNILCVEVPGWEENH